MIDYESLYQYEYQYQYDIEFDYEYDIEFDYHYDCEYQWSLIVIVSHTLVTISISITVVSHH